MSFSLKYLLLIHILNAFLFSTMCLVHDIIQCVHDIIHCVHDIIQCVHDIIQCAWHHPVCAWHHPVCGWPYHPLGGFFWWTEVRIFYKVQFIFFPLLKKKGWWSSLKRQVVRSRGNGEFLINRYELWVKWGESALERCCTTSCRLVSSTVLHT